MGHLVRTLGAPNRASGNDQMAGLGGNRNQRNCVPSVGDREDSEVREGACEREDAGADCCRQCGFAREAERAKALARAASSADYYEAHADNSEEIGLICDETDDNEADDKACIDHRDKCQVCPSVLFVVRTFRASRKDKIDIEQAKFVCISRW
jgi:hypothetical protein